MEITKETLLKYGMKEMKGLGKMLFPMEKLISKQKSEDGGRLAICVTNMRNRAELCLIMPDGSCLYLNIKTIEDLELFERCIESYYPNY